MKKKVCVGKIPWARGKRRDVSPGAAARPLDRTRVRGVFFLQMTIVRAMRLNSLVSVGGTDS